MSLTKEERPEGYKFSEIFVVYRWAGGGGNLVARGQGAALSERKPVEGKRRRDRSELFRVSAAAAIADSFDTYGVSWGLALDGRILLISLARTIPIPRSFASSSTGSKNSSG